MWRDASPLFLSGFSSGLWSITNRRVPSGEIASPSKPRFALRIRYASGSSSRTDTPGMLSPSPFGVIRIRSVPSAATCTMLGPYSSPSQ